MQFHQLMVLCFFPVIALIVFYECRGGEHSCPAGFVIGSKEVICLSSVLPSVALASAIGVSTILWSLCHNMIALTFHTLTGNLIAPRDACCQGIQMLWALHQFVFMSSQGSCLRNVFAQLALCQCLIGAFWTVMARVPAAPPCQAWPEFPRQFLAHGFATPVLLPLPYGKLPTVLQHRIYGAREVFTALWQPC